MAIQSIKSILFASSPLLLCGYFLLIIGCVSTSNEVVIKESSQTAEHKLNKEKYRVMMTTDFPPIGVTKSGALPNNQKSDPDDMQSIVRFLLYANEFDIEGLVATAGTFAFTADKQNILDVLDEYEKVQANLKTYDAAFPTADYLRSVTFEGLGKNHGLDISWGCNSQNYNEIIGAGLDSEASDAIIAAADKPDPRPIWIGVWGGPREIAQAIWKVKNERSKEELEAFIGKLRIFLIACQDASHHYLMDEFPELFIIESKKTYQGVFGGNDPVSDLAWVNKNIRFDHGPLCEIYPHEGMGCTGVCEGDSPTFMHLISAYKGINDPEDPTQAGWGGQYKRVENTNHYIDGPGGSTISQWNDDYQKDFKERADWCIRPKSTDAKASMELAFREWLFDHIPTKYPSARMTDHTHWLQAHINEDLVANWTQWNEENTTLKDMEAHALTVGKSIFIEKSEYCSWADHPAVTYHEGVGYHISGYVSKDMSTWNVQHCNVIQYDGDGALFSKEIAQAWRATKGIKEHYKHRVINTTDLGADPDDIQSMVRQLVNANEYDLEGLIVATGCWKKTQNSTVMLDEILNAYGQSYPNLRVHAEGFPTPEYLQSISVMGQTGYGMSDVGDGKDSPGSNLIIASVDKADPRPVWVLGWGGMNNAAQAIWKVKKTRSAEQLELFLSKLRLYDILGQDDAGAWIAKNFPDVFYIRATGVYGWQPPKNGEYQKNDIQSHGPLGAIYPDTKWATEGDSPAFMHLYPNGLNDPDQIDQGGWGGRFSFDKQEAIRSMSGVTDIQVDGETRFDPYFMYGNTSEKAKAIKKWENGFNNNFAARMDWSITDSYEDANHHPIAVLNGDDSRKVLEMDVYEGTFVSLSAEGSSDPDQDALHYSWSFYEEPSSYKGTVEIQKNESSSSIIKIPEGSEGKNIHIILEIHDDGQPNLYAYRRIILNVANWEEKDLEKK